MLEKQRLSSAGILPAPGFGMETRSPRGWSRGAGSALHRRSTGGETTSFSRLFAALLLLFAISLAPAQQYTISTIAGGVPPPTPVPGGRASIGAPQGEATEAAENAR